MLLNSAILVARACDLYVKVHGAAEKRELDNLMRTLMELETRQAQLVNKIIQDKSAVAKAKKDDIAADIKNTKKQLHQDIEYYNATLKDYERNEKLVSALRKKLIKIEKELGEKETNSIKDFDESTMKPTKPHEKEEESEDEESEEETTEDTEDTEDDSKNKDESEDTEEESKKNFSRWYCRNSWMR